MNDNTENNISIFNEYAKPYQDKFMEMDLYHHSFDKFCLRIKKDNAEVLEIGCGPGNITRYLLQQRPQYIITGIDLAENMLELASSNNPTANFIKMDCRDIDKLKNKFDAIMCGFCLPYLDKQEAIDFIQNARNLLQPGGVLYISTMEDDYAKSGYKPSSNGGARSMFIHYHEGEYLTKALIANEFLIDEITRQDYPEQDSRITIDLIIIATKK